MTKKTLTKTLLVLTVTILSIALVLAWKTFNYKEQNVDSQEAYTPVNHILFISSYSESFATVDLQKKGLEEALGSDVQMDIEYMDTKQYSDSENTELFYQRLAYKLSHHEKYDAIVLGDDAALTFGETYQQELFEGIPMVFFAVNDIDHAVQAGKNPYITGAVERTYLSETLEIAAKFQPQAKTVAAIYDDSLTGLGDQKQFAALKEKYPQYEYEGIDFSSYSLTDFETKLQTIDKNTILIYMDAFEDKDGYRYTIDQSISFISDYANTPVYRTSIGGVGTGLVGGMMVSYEDLGKQAGEIVKNILNGADVSAIDVDTNGIGEYMFDVDVLTKYNINMSLVPKNAVLVNQKVSFWSKHRGATLFAAFMIALLSACLSAYFYFRRRSTEVEKQNLDKTLNNLPVGIRAHTIKDGKVVWQSSNQKFRQLMNIANMNGVETVDYSKIHSDDISELKKTIEQLQDSGEAVHTVFRYRPEKHTKMLWYSADLRMVHEKDGQQTLYSVLNDITAQITAQEGRQRNRVMYELAADMAQLSLWRYDVASHQIQMSDTKATKKLCEIYHIPQLIENVPESEENWILPEDFAKYKEIYQKIEQGEKQVSCEYWYAPLPDGRQRCEYIVYTTVFDENGNPEYAYGIGQDITARKLEQRNYQRMYQQMAEANPDSICFFRFNLSKDRCENGQSKYPQLLNLADGGTVSSMFEKVTDAIVDARIQQECRTVFNVKNMLAQFGDGTTNVEKECPVMTAKNEFRWFRVNFHLVQNPDTGDVEAVTSAVDITKQKKDEQIIQIITMENHDFIGIIHVASQSLSLHDGVWGRHGLLSKQILSYTKEIERYASEYIPKEEQQAFLKNVAIDYLVTELKNETRPVCTYTLVTKKGALRKKQLYYTWLDHTQREIIVVQSDITEASAQEQKRNQELQAALEMAEQANKAKSDFVSRISHDIRTPISAITSMTDFALQDIDHQEQLVDDLKKIKSSNTFLLSLINDILDISKIDSGQIELHPEPYSCQACMDGIRDMFMPLCRQKGIHFETQLDSGSERLYVDKTRVNQIVLNLVSNAVKYTPENGTVQVHLSSTKKSDTDLDFVFEVSDNGIGMSDEFQKSMFEPFTQDENNPERLKLAGGTGLGLSIVKKLVTLMGGTITVDSEMGHGSHMTVHCDFPMYRESAAQSALKSVNTQVQTPMHGTVLLAEDNQINAEIAARLLDSIGLQSKRAVNGEEAWKMFDAAAPGTYLCVLMDIRMPVMNGYESAKKIRSLTREDAKKIPIIALTADAIKEDTNKAYDSGMNAYLTKPIDLQKLQNTIRELVFPRRN